jgi:hypothetical protein
MKPRFSRVCTRPVSQRSDHQSAPHGGNQSTARDDDLAYDIPPPTKRPEPGYYYHFKHDPDGSLNNYAYYIYGVGHHTEDDCRAEDAFMQVYRPLYEEAYAYRNGRRFDLRPPHMFSEPAQWKRKQVPRFTRIVDPDVMAQLEAIKARMYPNP